ncbi:MULTISPECIES: hypothetical protein [Chroococcidiopsis]|nr:MULTISPECIES: hypothetical protein [Chroococcidiopsis]
MAFAFARREFLFWADSNAVRSQLESDLSHGKSEGFSPRLIM